MALTPEQLAQKISEYGFYDISQLYTVQDTYLYQEPTLLQVLTESYALYGQQVPKYRDALVDVVYEDINYDSQTTTATATNITYNTSDKKLGNACAVFNGSSSRIEEASRANLQFGTEDFTIECYIKPNNLTAVNRIVSSGIQSGAYGIYALGIGGAWGTGPRINFAYYNSTGNGFVDYSTDDLTDKLTVGQWHYVAFCKQGNNIMFFLNGEKVKSIDILSTGFNFVSTNKINIGCRNSTALTTYIEYFNGSIDELRITKGKALYTDDFDYTTIIETRNVSSSLLMHFNSNVIDSYQDYAKDKFFIQEGSAIFYFVNGVKKLLTNDITQVTLTDFRTYGNLITEIPWTLYDYEFSIIKNSKTMTPLLIKLPPYQLIQQLDDPTLYILKDVSEGDLNLYYTKSNILYTLSPDNINFYSYNFVYGRWYVAPSTSVGMTSTEIKALREKDFIKLFKSGAKLWLRANLISKQANLTPEITGVIHSLTQYYDVGNFYCYTTQSQQSTVNWENIINAEIVENKPSGCEIFYAISINNKTSWYYWNGIEWKNTTMDTLYREGMTSTTMAAITKEQWLLLVDSSVITLDCAIGMFSNNFQNPPTVTSIKFNIQNSPSHIMSNFIESSVPEEGFRNILVNDTYVLKITDGIAFDDVNIDYDLYTTPDGVKIRPLDLGTLVGGVQSNIYAFELISGYLDLDLSVTLNIAFGNEPAEVNPTGTGGYLPDSTNPRYRSLVELSLGREPWTPVYPLSFRLNRDSKRTVYVRVSPQVITNGTDTFQIQVVGRKIS